MQRWWCGEDHPQNKLTEDQARQIRKLAQSGSFSLREIGQMFGVSKGTVFDIKTSRTWKHLWNDAPQKTITAAGVTAK